MGEPVREFGASIRELRRQLEKLDQYFERQTPVDVPGASKEREPLPQSWALSATGTGTATVHLVQAAPRRIGLLELPVTNLSIEFNDVTPELKENFELLLERVTQRGGG